MTESNSVEPQPASGVNLLGGGDQPLVVESAVCSTRGCWPTRIMRAVLVVAVLGSAGAYGALQANPNLATYIPLGNSGDAMPGFSREHCSSHCPLSGGCPLSASTASPSGCCSTAQAALAEASARAEKLVTGESAACPNCRSKVGSQSESGEGASDDTTPSTPESAQSNDAPTAAPAVAEPAPDAPAAE